MRAWMPCCLLAIACAGGPPSVGSPQRVELANEEWSVSYRLVVDDPATSRLEGWADITNGSSSDWSDAKLALATRDGRVHDLDGDGVLDRMDLCPNDAEDHDGYNEDDGCPDLDNDSDHILDARDRCPNEPETYNGIDDDDGCPDRGAVVSSHHDGGILDLIFFRPGSDAVQPVSLPIVDAVAATIIGNSALKVVEIGGHADRTERDPWSLSMRRAAAVSQRLLEQGVAPSRFTLSPYGATQPADTGTSATALAKNRRVGFVVVEQADEDESTAVPGARTPFDLPPLDPVDDLRYDLAQRVTLKRGATTRLAILDKPVSMRELLIWEPVASDHRRATHPVRALHVVNTTGFVLQAGPIEIVTDGRVLRRVWLPRTAIGANARIDGELETGATVTATTQVQVVPHRILGVERGELVVEDTVLDRTTYVIASPSAAIVELHHRRLPADPTPELPPATVALADRFVITREVAPGVPTTVFVTEPQVRAARHPITSLSAEQLARYLETSKLPADVHDRLRAVVTATAAIEVQQETSSALRTKLATLALRPVDRATRTELDETAREIGQTSDLLARELTRRDDLLRDLQLAPPAP